MQRLIAAAALLVAAPAGAQDVAVTVKTAPDGTRTLVHEAIIPGPIRAVWQAVATAAGWQSWAVPVVREGPDGQFETSYDPTAAPGSPGTIMQQWIARAAPRRATFRTVRTPAGFRYGDDYLKVVNTFLLEPAGRSATRVRLVGAGYPSGTGGDALLAFFRTGNSIGMRQLHARFVSGPVDWAAAGKGEK